MTSPFSQLCFRSIVHDIAAAMSRRPVCYHTFAKSLRFTRHHTQLPFEMPSAQTAVVSWDSACAEGQSSHTSGGRPEARPISKFERSCVCMCLSRLSLCLCHCTLRHSCILCVSHLWNQASWERYRRRRRQGRCLHHHLRRRTAPRPCGAPRSHSSHQAARGRRCYRRSRPRRGRARSAAWSLQ